MPEPIQSPAAPEPNKDLASILEGLTKLSDSVSTITERLDDFDTQIQEIGKASAEPPAPVAPVAPEPKWKPKTWDEFPAKAEEIAKTVAKQTYAEIEAERLKAIEDKNKQVEDLHSQIDQDFDKQMELLEQHKAIPVVKDVNDPNDEGKKVRKELFALGIKYNSPDLVAMSQLRDEWVSNGYTFDMDVKNPNNSKWIKSNPRPFGAGAPVGSSSSSAPSGNKPSYKDIHGLSMDEMIRRYNS